MRAKSNGVHKVRLKLSWHNLNRKLPRPKAVTRTKITRLCGLKCLVHKVRLKLLCRTLSINLSRSRTPIGVNLTRLCLCGLKELSTQVRLKLEFNRNNKKSHDIISVPSPKILAGLCSVKNTDWCKFDPLMRAKSNGAHKVRLKLSWHNLNRKLPFSESDTG